MTGKMQGCLLPILLFSFANALSPQLAFAEGGSNYLIQANCRGLAAAPREGLDEDRMHFRTRGHLYANRQEIVVTGAVRIEFRGNTVCADRMKYNRATNELLAAGSVFLLEPDGKVTHSGEMKFKVELGKGTVEPNTPPGDRRQWEPVPKPFLRIA